VRIWDLSFMIMHPTEACHALRFLSLCSALVFQVYMNSLLLIFFSFSSYEISTFLLNYTLFSPNSINNVCLYVHVRAQSQEILKKKKRKIWVLGEFAWDFIYIYKYDDYASGVEVTREPCIFLMQSYSSLSHYNKESTREHNGPLVQESFAWQKIHFLFYKYLIHSLDKLDFFF